MWLAAVPTRRASSAREIPRRLRASAARAPNAARLSTASAEPVSNMGELFSGHQQWLPAGAESTSAHVACFKKWSATLEQWKREMS